MDRFAAMLILLGVLVSLIIVILALFAFAPVFCSCLVSLLYTLFLFMANEESEVHHAQEHENRFWTIFALLFSTAIFFAHDSPLSLGRWSPSIGFVSVLFCGYAMHTWDRMVHRDRISQQLGLRRNSIATSSLTRLKALGIPVEEQLQRIHACLASIDQLLIPSTINNFINQRFVKTKEREIIAIFRDCDARALNYLVCHVKLGLLFYKIKDHRNFSGQHRTELIQLLAIERLPILTVISRVIVLHALQLMKLRANPRAEYWVRNIILNTHQEDLSELKTLTDAKGDYFCMNKLIFDDIRSETTRQDILTHLRKEATLQQAKKRSRQSWRKILSDVDDTLSCSGGSYPAGIDRRFAKKVVYPGVLAFYRELDLGTQGADEWPENKIGNLVFLSARPHVYKDMSEKMNFAKFEKLRISKDGQTKMHTTPSLLAGDLASGTEYMMKNNIEPLAQKKFDNFKRYVSIYPEYQHVFVCDNGQGDVKAGEMMFDAFPYEFEALYVHIVQDVPKTFGYAPERWAEKGLKPCFFRTYPEAALDAVTRKPPMMRISGLRRVCMEAAKDFASIRKWSSQKQKANRRSELNQAFWKVNQFLQFHLFPPVALIAAEQQWGDSEKVRTPYGIATIKGFDPLSDMYTVELDWRPLSVQVEEHLANEKKLKAKGRVRSASVSEALETVVESEENEEADANEASATDHLSVDGNNSVADASYNTNRQMQDEESCATHATGSESEAATPKLLTYAKIQGCLISKYTQPVLPKVDRDRTLFSFWSPPPQAAKTKKLIKAGEQCKTPYGLGVVEEHRQEIVVVAMVGWHAKAYLQKQDIDVVPRSVWGSLWQFSSAETKAAAFPEGSVIKTPFGEAKIVSHRPSGTLELSLVSWTLANNANPTLFCTVETAKKWKDSKGKFGKSSGDGLFTAFGNLFSKSFLRGDKAEQKTIQQARKFEQYYSDGAAVTTSYGDGVVMRFRCEDGFYEVLLEDWTLANGSNAVAILKRDDIKCRIAKGCHEGYPVLTKLGLTGNLASVEPTTGIHIVTIPSAGMVCYFQPSVIARPLKAAVGEDVMTAYGDGKVERYTKETDVYVIGMNHWNARLYAKAETFDRVNDGMQDRDGPFGMKWLLDMLFFTSGSRSGITRSNSVRSVSARSQSHRSLK